MLRHRRSTFCASFLCVIMMAAQVSAARGYERLSFTFDQPTQMRVAQQGNRIILSFENPVGETREQLLAKLGPHARDVTVSDGGRQVVIMLDGSYRTRQFTSGTKVGLDILTGDAKPPTATRDALAPAAGSQGTEVATAPSMFSTKEAPPASPPVVEEQPAPPPVAAVEPSPPAPVETPPAAPPIMTTMEEPEAAQSPAPPAAPVTAEQPAATPESPPPAPAEATAPILEQPQPATTPAEAPVTAPEAPAAASASEPAPAATEQAATPGQFLVTTKEADGGIWVNFPWASRVAAAAFERAGDIWIIFNSPQNINTALLRTVMPKAVIKVEQFYSESSTILRLTTDGSLHATARQPKGSYRWHILLSPKRAMPIKDTTVIGQSDDDKITYLLFKLFDSAAPLQFYDPRIGDKVIVFATFEEGQGLAEERQFPGVRVLSTQQGVVVTSLRDDLATEFTMVGLKLRAAGDLSVSRNLPVLPPKNAPSTAEGTTTQVMMPYDQWYIAPGMYRDVHAERVRNLANATDAARPDAMLSLVQLTMGQGYLIEALGHLNLIRAQYPDYYKANQLALLRAACNLLMNRPTEARDDIAATELASLDETQLWLNAVGLFFPPVQTPAPDAAEIAAQKGTLSNAGVEDVTKLPGAPAISAEAHEFDFLGYNQSYIRFYPPVIRQRLAILASEYYLKTGEPEKAIAVFDTLNKDSILQPIQLYAEFALGKTAVQKSQVKQALEILGRLADQHEDRYIQSLARYEHILLRHKNGTITAEEAEEALEHLRLSWRGDMFERQMLAELARMYQENKQYDSTLRIWKYLLTAFPNDPETLAIAGNMSDLFRQLFIGGEADAMPPLKSLALFYEFRELTPIGDLGDEIIQKLADRLAAVDLLDRAAQLLEHQVKFRVSGESRARIGARLALIHLLNQEPARALEVLQTTSFGGAAPELLRERQQLTAQALSRLGKHEDALVMLYNDTTREGDLLRLDILWAMKDWPNIINQAEDVLAERPNLTEPLTAQETAILLKLALAYNFEGDYTQLGYLRDYYIALVPESPMKEIFAFITNDTAPIDTEDYELVARQISNTESFLDAFKKKIAAGRLSETL